MKEVTYIDEEVDFKPILKEQIKNIFPADGKIAVKLHMGEGNSKTHLQPALVKEVISVMIDLGLKPFLFDSPVMYNSDRNTPDGYMRLAAKKGFNEEYLGCPVIVSNEHVVVKGKHMDYQVCKSLCEADGVLVLSHVKGHMCSGMGGAIKNLGMGALTKETKTAIHNGGKPEYVSGCTMCKACEKACPTGNIRYDDERPYFDKTWCCGCSACVYPCPSNALKSRVADFDVLLAEGASAAASKFKTSYYVNVLKSMTKLCDCMANAGKILFEDLGIVMSTDGVACDAASLDIIKEKAGKDIFKEANGKDPMLHVKEAETAGMGNVEYTLSK